MLVSLTVGKVDAGVTVLLTPDKRLIEFPSILLPPNISSGSIVDITVGRNYASESKAERSFRELQDRIFDAFGENEPAVPVLRCRNATQTSVVLEWDPIELATADLISLALYRNGQKAGNIPRPLQMYSTKISGLAVDTEYTFHLVLRTTAGVFSSDRVTVRTHKLTDLSGITITTGIMPPAQKEALTAAVERIGAKIVDTVKIDTTHFVTTEGRGIAWEKAVETNIPVVRPEWVDACEKSGRILGVSKFYLDAWRPGMPTAGTDTPVQTQKELPGTPQMQHQSQTPQIPSTQQQPESSESATPIPATAAAIGRGSVSGSENNDDDDDDDESENKVEQKSKGPEEQDEQKVRLEDKGEQNQGLAIRQGPSGSDTLAAAVSDDGKNEGTPDQAAGSSRASFQNVEL